MDDHASRGRRLSGPAAAGDLFPAREIEPEPLEAGRLLFARDCRFIAGAGDAAGIAGGQSFQLDHRVSAEQIAGNLLGIDAQGEGDLLSTNAPPARVGEVAAANGIVLHELTADTASLEEAFLELTAGETGL